MLNKRIKSLLVAGLLVFSMSGMAFAEGEDLPKSSTSTITYPDFEDRTFKDYELQDGNIILRLYKDSNGYRANIKWIAENFKVTGIKMTYEKLEGEEVETYSTMDIKLPGEVEEGQDCYVAIQEGEYLKVTVNDGITDRKLVKVEVMFENLTKDDEPVTPPTPPTPDPEEPEEDVDDPETGDASIMPIVTVAAVSAAGLFALRNKDDEE